MFKQIILTFIIFQFFVLAPSQAKAAQIQPSDFPVCANPQGSVISQYGSGVHGIPGSTASYQGSDTVYQLDANKLMQCFCATDGSGIQTNWQKAAGFTETKIKAYTDAGWILIQNGQNWGLNNAPYLSYNTAYECKNDNRTGGSSGSGSSGSSAVGGASASQSVLGLATTGDGILIYAFAVVGMLFVFLGLKLRRTK